MIPGKYRHNKTNFNKYEVLKFGLHLFDCNCYVGIGCGAAALALITGANPYKIRTKNQRTWTDDFMVRFLRKHGFSVAAITKCDVTNEDFYIKSPIKPYHIVLVSQLMKKNEASWSVLYNNYAFHNFEIRPLSNLEFLNHPILSAYTVYKKEWAVPK